MSKKRYVSDLDYTKKILVVISLRVTRLDGEGNFQSGIELKGHHGDKQAPQTMHIFPSDVYTQGSDWFMCRNELVGESANSHLDNLESFYWVLCFIICVDGGPGPSRRGKQRNVAARAVDGWVTHVLLLLTMALIVLRRVCAWRQWRGGTSRI